MISRILLTCALTTILSVSAQSATVTFSSLTSTVSGPASFTEDGVTVTSASGTFWAWGTSQQLHMDIGFGAGAVYDFQMADASLFAPTSFDVTYLGPDTTFVWTGYDSLNTVIGSETITATTLNTYNFASLTGLSRLRLEMTVGHASIDNVVLGASRNNTEEAPEPGTFVLLGLASAGLYLRRRMA